MELRTSTPSEKDGIMPCICFSECNLPGLVNHCERYGRLGFVFKKDTIFALGGRPTVYVDKDIYALIAQRFKNSANDTEKSFSRYPICILLLKMERFKILPMKENGDYLQI